MPAAKLTRTVTTYFQGNTHAANRPARPAALPGTVSLRRTAPRHPPDELPERIARITVGLTHCMVYDSAIDV